MFKFWRKRTGMPSITQTAEDVSSSDMDKVRENVEHSIRFLEELEKQLKLVELKFEADPGSCKSLPHPCARLEMKLFEMQGHISKLVSKLSRLT